MKTCSVVIPVYNCPNEQLRRCLDCFAGANEDIEILVIDDGSTNSCHTIVEECARSNTAIRLIRQSNMGVSGARTRGIEEAGGKYIVFCDADDAVDLSSLMKILSSVDGGDYDFVVADYKKVSGNDTALIRMDDLASSDGLLETFLCAPSLYGTVWAKLFRAEFIRTNMISFDMRFKHGEDSIFILDCLHNNPKIEISHESFYTYIVNRSSAAKSDAGAIDSFIAMLEAGKIRVDASDPSHCKDYALYCNINFLIMLVGFIFPKGSSYADGKQELRRVLDIKIIKDSLSSYSKNKTSAKNRLALFCLRMHWCYACYLMARMRNN